MSARKATFERKSRETEIVATVNLDGTGKCNNWLPGPRRSTGAIRSEPYREVVVAISSVPVTPVTWHDAYSSRRSGESYGLPLY